MLAIYLSLWLVWLCWEVMKYYFSREYFGFRLLDFLRVLLLGFLFLEWEWWYEMDKGDKGDIDSCRTENGSYRVVFSYWKWIAVFGVLETVKRQVIAICLVVTFTL